MIDKERLLKSRLAEDDYDIPGVGTVRFRVLSWAECAQFQALTDKGKDSADVYRRILTLALVDPVLSEDEVAEWMGSATGGEIENLVRMVITRSGLVEGAQKSV